MKFKYNIVYVQDVPETIEFYKAAFGIECKMMHESNMYAELETGNTVLAFANNEMAKMNGFEIRNNSKEEAPAGFEIAFETDTVQEHFDKACAAGAEVVKAPEEKPWGQLVSYVKDNNGSLVEICSPVG